MKLEEREQSLTAVLFVGGLSSRMGSDKATIEIDGEPLWQRQINLLRGLRPAALQISARARPSWCPSDIGVILDPPPSRGPLTGLTAALSQLQTSHLLALAVDLPRISVEQLTKIWKQTRPGCGVIPVNDGHLEPLCALYPAEAAAQAAVALRSSHLSLRALAKTLIADGRLKEYFLTEHEKPFFQNINSPEDLRSLGSAG